MPEPKSFYNDLAPAASEVEVSLAQWPANEGSSQGKPAPVPGREWFTDILFRNNGVLVQFIENQCNEV